MLGTLSVELLCLQPCLNSYETPDLMAHRRIIASQSAIRAEALERAAEMAHKGKLPVTSLLHTRNTNGQQHRRSCQLGKGSKITTRGTVTAPRTSGPSTSPRYDPIRFARQRQAATQKAQELRKQRKGMATDG